MSTANKSVNSKTQSVLHCEQTQLAQPGDRGSLLFFEEAPIAYHEIDRDGIIVRVNEQECALLGYTRSELIGKPVWHLVSEASQTESRQAITMKIAGTQPLHVFERTLKRANGESVLVEIHESLIKDVDGTVSGIRSALLDITSRRRGEELIWNYQQHLEAEVSDQTAQLCALNRHLVGEVAERQRVQKSIQESEDRYRATFENSPFGIYRIAISGEILMANPSLINMLGYHSFEELAAASPTSICDRAEFKVQIQRWGELRDFESSWNRADGSPICVRENARLIQDGMGQPAYFEGSVEDITERRQLEGQLRQAQKMEAVGRLAAGVAHDFNNILMVISGYSEVLSTKILDGDPSREAVIEIAKAARQGADLTKQLLSFSRLETLRSEVVDLNRLILNMEHMLRRLIGEHIELSIVLTPELGGIKANAGQISQVIMNLVVNARDAMPGGGVLRIETLQGAFEDNLVCTGPEAKHGHYVIVAINDTGCGMDSMTVTKIFEPFFTTKEAEHGTGLGLSTVYAIVKQFEGTIEVNSRPGEGSVFKLFFPAVQPASPEPERTPAALAVVQPIEVETILLVEDEELVRTFMKGALVRLGYQVLEAQDGEEALLLSASHSGPIHLVLTDVVMPGMQGPEVAHCIIQQRPETRAMFMSGYSDDVIGRGGAGAPGNVLRKPFTVQELGEKLKRNLGHGPR